MYSRDPRHALIVQLQDLRATRERVVGIPFGSTTRLAAAMLALRRKDPECRKITLLVHEEWAKVVARGDDCAIETGHRIKRVGVTLDSLEIRADGTMTLVCYAYEEHDTSRYSKRRWKEWHIVTILPGKGEILYEKKVDS